MAVAVDVGLYGDVFLRRVDYAGVGDTLPAHEHGRDHVTICCGGRLEVRIQNAPARTVVLAPGEWLEVPHGGLHDMVALDAGTISLCVFSTPNGDRSGTA